MAATSTVKTRIQLKNDTEENWNKTQGRFTPLKGEVIIYSTDDSHPYSRLKIGDGITPVTDLPFIDANSVNGVSIHSQDASYWQTQINYVPKIGEIVIYLNKSKIINGNEEIGVAGIKIGDGTTFLIDLPFLGQVNHTIEEHINNTNIHITSQERTFWNNKINCIDTINQQNLILTRI